MRARTTALLAAAILTGSAGCFVSFDGYQLAEGRGGASGAPASGAAGAAGTGGAAGSGGLAGGAGTGAAGQAGVGGAAGTAGAAGQAGFGGDTAGSSGTAGVAAQAGQAGANGGTGGTAGGAGKAGAAAAAGTAGAGGDTSGAGGAGTGGVGGAGAAGAGGDASGAGGAAAAGAGGGEGGAGGAGGSPLACPFGLPGPALVKVPLVGGTGHHCVDATEVTMADYQDFLDAAPSVDATGVCAFNTSHLPQADGSNCTNPDFDPVNSGDHPVRCVDWCDARDYCKWAGKHLCGAIGGGPGDPASFADATKDEWYNACSRNGERTFAWGNTYDSTTWSYCADLNNTSATSPLPTQSTPKCVGGFPGLKDMSGNVDEWVNTCSGNKGATDGCLVRGGNIYSDGLSYPSVACHSGPLQGPGAPASRKRSVRHDLTGFRCCYTP